MAAQTSAERDVQSYAAQMAYLVNTGQITATPLAIPLDDDLAKLYVEIGGDKTLLGPTDVLLVQCLRLLRSMQPPAVPQPPIQPPA